MSLHSIENDSFFYHEMLVHPALFTHQRPQTVAITGDASSLLPEVLKHPNILDVYCLDTQNSHPDPRVKYPSQPSLNINTYDIIIHTITTGPSIDLYCQALKADGLLVMPAQFSLLQPKSVTELQQQLKQAGFSQLQLLHFSQPSYSNGWRTIIMATKSPVFKRVREKDVYNKPFTIRYYNYDVHQAALALPEYVKEELALETV
jgi:spermidine synthase